MEVRIIAGPTISKPAPGVERIDFMMGYHLYGTKTALLAAKLARREWFTDGRQRADAAARSAPCAGISRAGASSASTERGRTTTR